MAVTRASKRKRPVPPTEADVLWRARQIWSRDPDKERAESSEEGDFRSFFGCLVGVFLTCWGMLDKTDLLPQGGRLEHLLWALMFMKLYSGQKALCALAGVDPETFRKWVWSFTEAISMLEHLVVSSCPVVLLLLQFCAMFSFLHLSRNALRLYGRIGFEETKVTTAW